MEEATKPGRPSRMTSPKGSSGPASPALARIKVNSQSPISSKSPSMKFPMKSPKSPQCTRSPKTPSFVPAGVITPVPPRTPKDMMGAQTSMDTGITYPVNVWGPTTKFGYLEDVPTSWSQKKHFEGKHDKLMKKRLVSRKFCHVRHPAYKELIEPLEHNSSLYLDPKRKEFWRTDVERVLHRDEDKRKARYKELIELQGNEKGWRDSELCRDRKDRWQAFLDLEKNKQFHPGFRNNKTGAAYDIFTLKCHDGYEGQKIMFKEQLSRYKQAARGLYLQERQSGARMYNIINWLKTPPCRTLPPFPEDLGPPPPPAHDLDKIPLNASKGALSFAYQFGPFGTIP